SRVAYFTHGGVFRQERNLGHFALSEEGMNHRFRLVGKETLLKQFGLVTAAFEKRQPSSRLHGVDGGERRHLVAPRFAGLFSCSVEHCRSGSGQLRVAIARLSRLLALSDDFPCKGDCAWQ